MSMRCQMGSPNGKIPALTPLVDLFQKQPSSICILRCILAAVRTFEISHIMHSTMPCDLLMRSQLQVPTSQNNIIYLWSRFRGRLKYLHHINEVIKRVFRHSDLSSVNCHVSILRKQHSRIVLSETFFVFSRLHYGRCSIQD